MKKLMSIFVVLSIVGLTLTGCSQPTKSNTSSNNSSSSVSSDISASSNTSSTSSSDASSATSATTSSTVSSTTSSDTSSATSVSTSVAASAKNVASVASTVVSGTYTSARSVALKTTTSAATVYYTTDGSTPTTSSTKYTSSFTVSKTSTIKAFAAAAGLISSTVSTFNISISVPTNLPGNIIADGSTALQPLLIVFKPLFEQKYETAFNGTVNIGGGGSTAGQSDVEGGIANLGDSDITVAQADTGYNDLVDHKVCTVGVAVVVSSDVAPYLPSMTQTDLISLYGGSYKTWGQVPDLASSAPASIKSEAINLIYRNAGSGTRILFELYGLNNTGTPWVAPDSSKLHSTSVGSSTLIYAGVTSTPGSIAYEAVPYVNGLHKVNIDFGSGAVACNYSNIDNGSYKIWGNEHVYTKGPANITEQAFIDFITDPSNKNVITSNGYGNLADLSSAALRENH